MTLSDFSSNSPLSSVADDKKKLMDFTKLKEENEEIEFWLTIDSTVIDFPVVIGTDNKYYLTHTAQHKKSALGAIFADFRTNKNQLDFNTVIYGHNTRNGKMFGTLKNFKQKDFFQTHKTGTLYSPSQNYRLEIFACIVTKHDSEIYRYGFESISQKNEHIKKLRDEAIQWREIDLNAQSQILVLSTCSNEYKNARTVILAKLVALK